MGNDLSSLLTIESIVERRNYSKVPQQLTFRVAALYGLSFESIPMPLNETDSIESGQISVTIDPEADPSCNIGIIDYAQKKLTVRYGVQAVFPGLYSLINNDNLDPNLLNPVRIVATDECTFASDQSGWHALGCLDFLPGSIWAGATGG